MNKELNPKVKQLFEAVTDLIEEGMDIHTMKVIDITNRAGIGKGTAYEYFKSKEELVAAALVCDMKKQLESLKEKLLVCGEFKKQLYVIFEWMDENSCRKRSGQQVFKMMGQSYEITAGIRQEFEEMAEDDICLFKNLIGAVRRQGILEGKIRENIEDNLVDMTIISNYITYFLYLNYRPEGRNIAHTPEEVRDFLYGNLERGLGSCQFSGEMV